MNATTLRPEERALILAALAARVKAEQEMVKAEFSVAYVAGSKQTFRSPLGDALGYVQRTDPAPEWRITDEPALRKHLAAEFPGVIEQVVLLAVPGVGLVELDQLDELHQVLAEHAPHLLLRQERVTADAVAAALEQSKATGTPAAPGITYIRPGGTLRVVPDKAAPAAVERMVAAGIVGWDGRALPARDGQVAL